VAARYPQSAVGLIDDSTVRLAQNYRDAIKEDLPDDVAAVVQRQYEGVKRNHDQIRALRNQHRATAE